MSYHYNLPCNQVIHVHAEQTDRPGWALPPADLRCMGIATSTAGTLAEASVLLLYRETHRQITTSTGVVNNVLFKISLVERFIGQL